MYGDVHTVKKISKILSNHLVLRITSYGIGSGVTVNDGAGRGEDEDGDVDEFGDENVRPTLSLCEFEDGLGLLSREFFVFHWVNEAELSVVTE